MNTSGMNNINCIIHKMDINGNAIRKVTACKTKLTMNIKFIIIDIVLNKIFVILA
jgi:hypothetical protein